METKPKRIQGVLAVAVSLSLVAGGVPAVAFAGDDAGNQGQPQTIEAPAAATVSAINQQIDAYKGVVTLKDLGEKFGIESGTTVRLTLEGQGIEERLEGMYTSGAWLPKATLASGEYRVKLETYKLFGGWSTTFDNGTLQVNSYYNVSFSVEGTSQGAAYVGGSAVTEARAYDGKLQFTVANVKGCKATVTLNDAEITPDQSGAYSVEGLTGDASVKVSYLTLPATVTTGTVENATVAVNDNDLEGSMELGTTGSFTVTVTPAEGYALVESPVVRKNGSEDALVDARWTYEGGVATAAIKADAGDTFEIEAVAQQTKLAVSDASIGYLPSMSVAELRAAVLKAAYNQGETVPEGIAADDLQVEYNAGGLAGAEWEPLDYKPLQGEALHAFGANGDGSTEQVRFTYAGTDRFPGMTAEAAITLRDTRLVTQIVADGATVTYGDEAAMNKALFDQIDLQVDGASVKDGTALADYTFTWSEIAAGTQEVTIAYAGDETQYKGSTLTAAVQVEKAKVEVSVPSFEKTYGDADPDFAAELAFINPEDRDLPLGDVRVDRSEGENVGTYEITGATCSNENYCIVLTTAPTLTIVPAELTLTPKAGQSKVQGEDDPELLFDIEGIVNGEEDAVYAALSLKREPGEEAGTYKINAYAIDPEAAGVMGNYTVSFTEGSFEIVKKEEPVKPIEPTDPAQPADPDGKTGNQANADDQPDQAKGAESLPKTGDPLGLSAGAVAAGMAVAGAGLLIVGRRLG